MITKETYYEVELHDLADGWTTVKMTEESLRKLQEEITDILGDEKVIDTELSSPSRDELITWAKNMKIDISDVNTLKKIYNTLQEWNILSNWEQYRCNEIQKGNQYDIKNIRDVCYTPAYWGDSKEGHDFWYSLDKLFICMNSNV